MYAMEDCIEAAETWDDEEIVGPGHAVVAVTDVWVRVVPRPKQVLTVHNVQGQVEGNGCQTNCNVHTWAIKTNRVTFAGRLNLNN